MIHNVKAYGAVGDGRADDRAEIAAAIAAARRGGDHGIYFPAGTYRIASDLPISCSSTLAPGATLSVDAGKTVNIDGALVTTPTRIFSGRGRIKFGEGRVLEVLPQWWGAVDDQGASTDSTHAIQSALDSLGIWGGRVVIPHGRYVITSTITIPPDLTDGRTIEIVGYGEAVMHNRAPANNPTLQLLATNQAKAFGVKLRNLVFTGEAQFPNKGVHWRFVLESLIEDCIFNCHGNAIYVDGGAFGLVFRNIQIWPTTRKHRSPTTHTDSSGILFDTPAEPSFAHTITIDDVSIEAGGRGVELKPGYDAFAWRIGRVLAEGLTGGDGWGLDLYHLRSSQIGPLYTEHNTPGAVGDASDRALRLRECARVGVNGADGTGMVQLRNCTDVLLQGITCNRLDADATNERVTIIGLLHSVMTNAASGYVNASGSPIEIGVVGASGRSTGTRVDARLLRGTPLEAGAGPFDDVRAKNSALRWANDAETNLAQRFAHLVNTVDHGGDWDLGIRSMATLFINTTNGEFAQFVIRGALNTSLLVMNPSRSYSTVRDNGNSINVYYDDRTRSYHVQNRIGGQREIVVFMMAVT